MLGLTALGLVAVPFAAPGLALADLARGRVRLPAVRVYFFLLRYGVNDSAEILLAPWYWVLAGFGAWLHTPASIRRHERVQQWSVETLARSARRWLGLGVGIDPQDLDALEPAPAIVLCRHVSLFDSSLPALLGYQRGLATRGVIMAELLADPGFDLFYRRTGSVFIAREQGPEARAAVATMGGGLDRRTSVAIFPEGRLFRPEVRDRFRRKIEVSDPDRASRIAGLRHVLPPRVGGFAALLDALPGADVVVVSHAGLDAHGSFRSLARSVPLRTTVRVRLQRIARFSIPDDPEGRSGWLDDVWIEMDEWVDRQLGGPAPGGPEAATAVPACRGWGPSSPRSSSNANLYRARHRTGRDGTGEWLRPTGVGDSPTVGEIEQALRALIS